MKNQTSFMLIALIVFISFLGCQESKDSEKQVGSEYSEQIKQIIDAKNAKIQAWYSAGLIDSVASHFADNCIQMPPNQPPLIGNENFKAAWNQNIQYGKWQFELKAEKVKANGDLATELGKYSLSFTPNENSPIPAMMDKGNYVVLWERINEDWKIVWDAPVSELPMPNQVTESTSEE
jgi:ketosteroid isomerase-like protein